MLKTKRNGDIWETILDRFRLVLPVQFPSLPSTLGCLLQARAKASNIVEQKHASGNQQGCIGSDIVGVFEQVMCWLESLTAETTASDMFAPAMLDVRFSKSTI